MVDGQRIRSFEVDDVSREQLPEITLSGSPFERGLQHGESFDTEVAANVDCYLSVFEHYGASREDVLEEAVQYHDVIENQNESYAQEVRGVAEGSDLPLSHVALLNARYEVIYSAYKDKAESLGSETPPPADGCTSFGVRPEVTADGRTYVGQNWDWLASVEETMVVTTVERTDGPNHVAVTEAGIVGGKMGVNEAGIGLVVNGLVTPQDGETPYQKPFHVRCREILEADRFDRAIAPVVESDRTCAGNFLIGHHVGELIDLEAAPETVNYLSPENGILTHANHFEDQTDVESSLERLIPHTLCRGPRLRRLLEQERGAIDVEVLKGALRDHFDFPASICHHVDPELPAEEHEQTNVSVILDLEDRSLLATSGPPCERAYRRYRCP